MANKKIKGITIEIGADTLGLDKALSGIEKAGKSTASELREVNTALKSVPDSIALWKQKQELLNKAVEQSREKLQLLLDSQEQVTRQFNEGNINEEQYRAFQREVEYARGELARLENQLTDTNNSLHQLENAADNAGNGADELGDAADDLERDLDEAGDAADELSDDLEDAGDAAEGTANGGLNALTVAFGNLIYDGIKLAASELKDFTSDVIETGRTFESSMSGVGAISGATADDLEKLSDKAAEMGATTKYTASESAEAFKYMAMAGWKTEEMLNGIDGVLSLAAASGEDLATTSDIVTDAMTAFGLSADNAGHFADVLAAASSNANTNVSMMGETFKYVAPIAGSMGYSVEDTAEAIGIMANSGIKATNAGTALRSIMTRLSTDAGASGKSLGALGTLTEKLGVQFYNADGSARDFGDVLSETREKWKDLNDEEQTFYGKKIAGTNAISGWLALMNAAPADVEKLSGAIRDCDGAAQNMSTTMLDNLAGDMTILESAVDGMKLSLSKELSPVLRDMTQYATKQIPNVQKALSGMFKTGAEAVNFFLKNLPKVITVVKTVLPVVTGALSAVAAYKVAEKALKAEAAITSFFAAIKAGTLAVNPLIAGLAAAVGLAVTAVALLNKEREKEVTVLDEVTEKYKDEYTAVDDLRKSMNGMKDDFYARASDINAETKRTEDLWKELDKLTDSTGKVKDADKKRAEYILGELNNALGTEYTMTGNQIDRYKEMESEIDTLIEKKKASLYLDEFASQAAEQKKIQSSALEAYEAAYSRINDLKNSPDYEEFLKADERYKELTGKSMLSYNPTTFWESVENGNAKNFIDAHEDWEIAELGEITDKWERMAAELSNNNQILSQNQSVYDDTLRYQSQLDEAETAFAQGDYSRVEHIIYDKNSADLYTLQYESDLEKRQEAFQRLMTKSMADIKLAIDTNSQYAADQAFEALKDTVEAGEIATDDLAKIFKNNFMGYVQQMLDKGFDISGLAKWGKDSGLSVADVFSGDFKTIVQQQIDLGFDPTALIMWGANSGMLVAGDYDEEFQNTVQAALNEFNPDMAPMVQWALDNGASLGEIFGEQFLTWSTKYNWATNDLQTHNINSASDAMFYASGDYQINYASRVGRHAAGGFISDKGIVAEAGPELLEIMNGGIKVTPLSRTAKNTPLIGAEERKVINNYITVNATVSNDYDVKRLAEKLAAEQQRVDRGKGK